MQQPNYIAYPKRITQSFQNVPPANYQKGSPPFVNQSFDRFNGAQRTILPYRYVSHPLKNPPGQPQLRKPGQVMSTSMPDDIVPPPQYPYKYSHKLPSHGSRYQKSNDTTVRMLPPKQDFKDNAFSMESESGWGDRNKGRVYDHHVDDLSKHKDQEVQGTQKTKWNIDTHELDSSDDEEKLQLLNSALSQRKDEPYRYNPPVPSTQNQCSTCGSHLPVSIAPYSSS